MVGTDTISYTISRDSGENVGSYTIIPKGETEHGNYKVSYKTGTFTITSQGDSGHSGGYGDGGSSVSGSAQTSDSFPGFAVICLTLLALIFGGYVLRRRFN